MCAMRGTSPADLSAFHLCSPGSFSFFFYCSGHRRDLHSFPTRRSSDLRVLRRPDRFLFREDPGARQHLDEIRAVLQDRKSTRLNSSHTVISYAVFCLKKKNTDIQDALVQPWAARRTGCARISYTGAPVR